MSRARIRHIITFLPNKVNILKNGTVLLELSPYTKVEIKNNELAEYLYLIIERYNQQKINLDEYTEIKKILVRVDYKDLLTYKEDIFKVISIDDMEKRMLGNSKCIEKLENTGFKSDIGKLLNMMYLTIFHNNKIISNAILQQMQLLGYKKICNSSCDIENNIEIIRYMKKDIANDPNFYIGLISKLVEDIFDKDNDLELIAEFNRHIKDNIVNAILNYLDREEEHEVTRNENLTISRTRGYISTRVEEISKMKRNRR